MLCALYSTISLRADTTFIAFFTNPRNAVILKEVPQGSAWKQPSMLDPEAVTFFACTYDMVFIPTSFIENSSRIATLPVCQTRG